MARKNPTKSRSAPPAKPAPKPKRKAKSRARKPQPKPVPAELSSRLEAPPSGVTVRMYRQGHGDCFLLAFRDDGGEPFYLLIDCGMKRGSTLSHSITQVAQNIRAATGGHVHLVAITHEHEDHVSGFRSERKVFDGLRIDRLWLAWTEDPEHPLANELRAQYKDTLLGLVAATTALQAAVGAAGPAAADRAAARASRVVDTLVDVEVADDDRVLAAADLQEKIKGRTNKEGILVVKRRAELNRKTEYLRPHAAPKPVPGGARVFVLGPPENGPSLKDMDPQGDEEFHFAAAEERSFLAAFAGDPAAREAFQPFATKHRVPAVPGHPFFDAYYFAGTAPDGDDCEQGWRRIDGDWLRSSEAFALRMNTFVNNTSLVLAFELPRTRKVLLFVGDAQRGNWVSWHEKPFPDGNGGQVTAADLLGRTVFYKVGHHGSHNATMNQKGLKDMATGPFADEFTAMIPANEDWALTSNDPKWRHPLKEIYQALLKKARGRVFVMDRPLTCPPTRYKEGAGLSEDESLLAPADRLPEPEWDAFLGRTVCNDLFYQVTIED